MDDATKALVKAAGLEATAARFPGDVQEALALLAKYRATLPRSSDPKLEPIPAYGLERRVKDTA